MKTDLQASQAAMKTDLQASLADMKSYLVAQSYKIIVSMSAIFVGALAFFDTIGIYIHFPWRKLGRSSPPGP